MELLKQYFDTAFDSPNGIKELRNLILKLAMMGKLVPQDKNDQPASELLKEIKAEKEKLIAEGKIKKQKPLPEIKADEVPYELPEGWVWTRLGEIVSKLGSGSTPRGGKEAYVDSGIMFFRSQNIYDDGIRTEKISFITPETHEKMKNTKIQPNDILFNITGGSLGRSALVPLDFTEGNLSQHVCIIRPILVDPTFMHETTLSTYFHNYIPLAITGGGREGLQKNKMELFPIALPPLNEQKRIVAKINELMARCDEMERLKKAQQEKKLKINTAALHQLMESSDSGSFSTSFSFITNNFSTLYSVKENVEELKKSILQLSMMGKLVPQDRNDQPASDLLKEIKAEKEKLIAEGKIKKQKALPEIKADEVPYELPEGWVWTRLGEFSIYNGRSKISNSVIDGDTWLLDLADIEKDTSKLLIRSKFSERDSKSTKSAFYVNDVLYGKLRPYLNKVLVADENGVCTTEIVPITPLCGVDSHFTFWLLKRPQYLEYVEKLMYGVKMPRLGTNDAILSIHPLPPPKRTKKNRC